jgi:branched-chain amino acid transport system permease protein
MSPEIVLGMRGLTKEFHGFTAVDSVDLRVQKGHIRALNGPNGAGKTTVFNLLTKFLPPIRGEILYLGNPITRLKPNEIARLGLVRSFQIAGEDHLYGLLLTFGLALIVEGSFVKLFGVSGSSYPMSELLKGGYNLGFMFLTAYHAWVVVAALVVCLATWFMIERTRLGSYLRAGTENPKLKQVFGINVPLLITLTYGYGAALAAFAGVLAAPIYSVTPTMGANLLIVVFAMVVIGGMGSIMGTIVTSLAMGLIEGVTKVFYPEAANTVVFLVMVLVLLVRPAGLFGKEA